MSPSKKPQRPIDVYVRVSRVGGREGDSYQSPGVQEERCRAYLAAHGYEVGEVLVDEDHSGGKMDRPAFNRAMERALTGASGGICVAKFSRFGRTTSGVLKAIKKLEDTGAALLSIDPALDTSTPTGRFVVTMFAALNQMELETISETWKTVNGNARRRGVYIAPRIPFGYRKNENGNLAQDEAEAELVEQVFRQREAGASWQAICDWLDLQGARTPVLGDGTGPTGGGNRWTEGALRKLVQNPVYKGEPKGGDDMPEQAKAALKIVSARLWEKAQPRNGGRKPRTPDGALLAGLVRCGSCGGIMTPEIVTKSSGTRVQTYRCRQRAAGVEKCPAPMTVSGNLLEPYMVERWVELAAQMGLTWEERDEGELESLREAVADAIHDRDEFERTALEEGMKPADIARMLARYTTAVESAQQALAEAQDRAEVRETLIPAEEIRPAWDEMGVPRKRAGMHEVFTSITVRRGKQPIAERVELELHPAWRSLAVG